MKRKIFMGMVSLILLACLIGCASWQTNMVKGYEAAGVMGQTYYTFAKTSCDNKTIEVNKCDQLKKINNDARKIYLTAGDGLILAIKVEDAVQREQLMTEYQQRMVEFNKLILDFVKLLRELKVL